MRDVQRAQLSRIDTDESPNRGLGVSFSRMIKASKGPFLGLNSDFETRRAKICQKYLAQNSGNDMEAQIRKAKMELLLGPSRQSGREEWPRFARGCCPKCI